MPPELLTTHGPKTTDDLGLILPHEHVFVDLGPREAENWRAAREADVIPLMAPELEAAKAAGVTALVECTPVGVGRRADIDAAVAEAADLPVVVPTGIYREPWVPDWAREAGEDDLRDWMLRELTDGIEDAGLRAAWIKLSAGDDGVTDLERRILRAAGAAGAEAGAAIGSHTIRADVVHDQLDVLESVGFDPARFVWIHAQREPDEERHLEIARRGAWIEYDQVGGDRSDADYLDLIERAVAAGFADRVLLSQDRGWYDPSEPGGGEPAPYTYLPERFLPKLCEAVGEETAAELTRDNPFAAFAR